MKSLLSRFSIVLTLLVCGLPLSAQSWDGLRRLNPGDQLKVLDTGGSERRGLFASVSADAIMLRTENSEVAIEKARVQRVEVRSGAKRARKVAIGAAIGVAVGVTIDQTLGTRFRNESQEGTGARAVTYVAPIALFGGIAGAFPAYQTVYRIR